MSPHGQKSGAVSAGISRGDGASGFTLIELLVVISIVAVIAGVLLPALNRARESARTIHCSARMRELGTAMELYVDSGNRPFPRSQHSAAAHGEMTWGRVLARHLGADESTWPLLLRSQYHCPSDRRTGQYSYGLNVYFELGPDDDYEGKPATWRYRTDLARPSFTILFGENASSADHIMPNFWTSPDDVPDLAHDRHRGAANYVFADGHVEKRVRAGVYDPAQDVDAWHPLKAR